MIKSEGFITYLNSQKIRPFLMVPCSIFKPLSSWLMNNDAPVIFPPNEAHAMGFAVGSYCASGQPAAIFLQNSGLNNIANCQTSLNLLYKIPVLLVVSWRGEPGKKDAPEHKIMGKDLKKFLKMLQIPFLILSEGWQEELQKMVRLTKGKKSPTALIAREGIFDKEDSSISDLSDRYPLSRLQAIKIIKDKLKGEAVFISTNGFTSRDSFAVSQTADFYMMGSMGHAFPIGAGVAWNLAGKGNKLRTIVFDGDGGCLMHLGSLALVGIKRIKESKLVYVLLDNEAYESTGSQPTLSPGINFLKLAEALGFPKRFFVKRASELKNTLKKIKPDQATFIQVKVNRKKVEEAARVSDKYTCRQITERFMDEFRR